MRASTMIPLSAAVLATVGLLSAGLPHGAARRAHAPSNSCRPRIAAAAVACADSEPLPAGDAPVFLLASVQPLQAPEAWRRIYHEVERCAGMEGAYDRIRWGVMEAPLQGPKGPTFAFTVGQRIVLVRNDTTYLRHEMLHHILEVAGWEPRPLAAGEHYTIADLHPMPLFGLCTGGR
jgi:hypothetical protein